MKPEICGFPPYHSRVIDPVVKQRLQLAGAVVLEGPRACGKTMTGLFHANSAHFLDTEEAAALAQVDPSGLLSGDAPVLLDEWQIQTSLWNRVRREVDKAVSPGRFILTGSSVPADDVTRHTGAGRFLRLRMHTLTTYEKDLGTGAVSLAALARGEGVTSTLEQISLNDVIHSLLTSGFPAQAHLSPAHSLPVLNAYLEEITRVDMQRLENLRTSPSILLRLIAAVARNVANEATLETLTKDVRRIAPDIAVATVARLLEILKRLFVVEEIPAFTTELRSRARLRKAGKYHLADPALAAAALNASADHLRQDLKTTGYIFESAVIHDLAVYAQTLGAKLWHYRDSNGHEIDAVLTFPDGGWAGVEVKLGSGQITAGAQSLQRAAAQIAGPPPKFLAVITGTGYTANLNESTVTFPLRALNA